MHICKYIYIHWKIFSTISLELNKHNHVNIAEISDELAKSDSFFSHETAKKGFYCLDKQLINVGHLFL